MRITKELIDRIANKIVHTLINEDLLIWDEPADKLEAIVQQIITEDLQVEDRLNEEVKMLLETRTQEYERDMMDYGRAFQMVKKRLVKERGIIL